MQSDRWSENQTWEWYRRLPWIFGVNFLPSTAANSTECWQRETFDAPTIERELSWGAALGFNSVRVFLQYLVWREQHDDFLERFELFLSLAATRNLSVMPVLFDDCSFGDPPIREPSMGVQREPTPGMIASNWTPSPGLNRVQDESCWPDLERYVTDLISRHAGDSRIIAWDIYNEPGNSSMGDRSLPLLQRAFAWARSAGPAHPLVSSPWSDPLENLNRAQDALSDIVSFHCYGKSDELRARIERCKTLGRPVICTEWMARLLGSRWEIDLPLFKSTGVGCYSWGLVNGRMQCQFPWWAKPGDPPPAQWFSDLLHPDGAPYDPAEIAAIARTIRND